ncbi:MAG TPA: hypothetical protein VK053_08535 [Jiangellaceae bacterium]|nr:hypothetical protein [Jiangellaceae bacterium]
MTRTDRTGNEINEFGVPTGPIDHEPTAVYHADGSFKDPESQEAILLDTLLRAGVELGEYDRRMVRHFAYFFDWQMMGTVASWIERAGKK